MNLIMKEVIAKVLSWLKDPIVAKEMVLSSIGISANATYTSTSISIASVVPSGYTPIAVALKATGSNAVYCYQCGLWSASGKTAVLQLKNTASSAVSVIPIFVVISVKDR